MSKAGGYSTPLSLGRRVTCDFLRAGMRIPLVSIQKTMNLEALLAARQAVRSRPIWCAVFTKAFGRVVASRPDLRRAFLTFPYERIYHDPTTTADLVVEARRGDENVLIAVPQRQPESTPLREIDRTLALARDDPFGRVRRFRRALTLARLPALVRRLVWWAMLNLSGQTRAHFLGTFGVTTVGNWGVESLRPIAPWTLLLHYGVIDALGRIVMRLTYDHRVLDGAGPATALVEMEQVLQTEMIAELNALREEKPGAVLPRAG